MIEKKNLRAALAALVLAAGSAVATAAPDEATGIAYGRTAAPAPIEGAWEVRITPYNCTSGAPIVVAAFNSLMMFGADGTMLESTQNVTFQPGQRTAGFGSWERSGASSYHALFQAFVLSTAGMYTRGTQRVELEIELVDRDSWSGQLTVLFRDVGGTQVPPSGCAALVAKRLQ